MSGKISPLLRAWSSVLDHVKENQPPIQESLSLKDLTVDGEILQFDGKLEVRHLPSSTTWRWNQTRKRQTLSHGPDVLITGVKATIRAKTQFVRSASYRPSGNLFLFTILRGQLSFTTATSFLVVQKGLSSHNLLPLVSTVEEEPPCSDILPFDGEETVIQEGHLDQSSFDALLEDLFSNDEPAPSWMQ